MLSSSHSKGQQIGLIPHGTVSKAVLNVRGIKPSQKGGQYIDCEFTLVGGEFNGRKVWSIIMDPYFAGNSQQAKDIGSKFSVRLLETAGVPEATYSQFTSIQQIAEQIAGKECVIKVGIKKGEGGYQDKNTVLDYLSPNPESGTSESFKKVMSGVATPSASSGKPTFLSSPKTTNPF